MSGNNTVTLIDPEIEAEIVALEVGASAEIEPLEDAEPRQVPVASAEDIEREIHTDIANFVQTGRI